MSIVFSVEIASSPIGTPSSMVALIPGLKLYTYYLDTIASSSCYLLCLDMGD